MVGRGLRIVTGGGRGSGGVGVRAPSSLGGTEALVGVGVAKGVQPRRGAAANAHANSAHGRTVGVVAVVYTRRIGRRIVVTMHVHGRVVVVVEWLAHVVALAAHVAIFTHVFRRL